LPRTKISVPGDFGGSRGCRTCTRSAHDLIRYRYQFGGVTCARPYNIGVFRHSGNSTKVRNIRWLESSEATVKSGFCRVGVRRSMDAQIRSSPAPLRLNCTFSSAAVGGGGPEPSAPKVPNPEFRGASTTWSALNGKKLVCLQPHTPIQEALDKHLALAHAVPSLKPTINCWIRRSRWLKPMRALQSSRHSELWRAEIER
jgi:hypothetical protein